MGQQNIPNSEGNRSPVVIAVVAAILAVFLAAVLIPQTVWVNLSMKLFH